MRFVLYTPLRYETIVARTARDVDRAVTFAAEST